MARFASPDGISPPAEGKIPAIFVRISGFGKLVHCYLVSGGVIPTLKREDMQQFNEDFCRWCKPPCDSPVSRAN